MITAQMAMVSLLLGLGGGGTAKWNGPLGDGVVVDLERPAVYVMASTGPVPVSNNSKASLDLIRAVDPRTGKALWTSTAAVKPLLVVGDRLLAVGAHDTPRGIVVLDARTGEVAKRCKGRVDKAPFIPVFDELGANYTSQAFLVDGKPIIVWTRDTYYAGGAAPPPDVEESSRTHTASAVAVDLATGCAETVAVPQMPPALPRLEPGNGTRRFKAHGIEARVTSTVTGHTTRIMLHLTRGRETLEPIQLVYGQTVYATASSDLEHIGAFEMHVGERGQFVYDWRIVELATGQEMEFSDVAAQPGAFVVRGSVVIARTASIVQGLSRDGAVLWSETVRPTAYAGPYPP